MSDWPSDWPPEMKEFWTRKATENGWNALIIEGVRRNIEYIRSLDESSRVPRYFHSDRSMDGHEDFFKAVEDDGELVVVRQIVIGPEGTHRYWWRVREDEEGFLTDQPMPPDVEGLLPISADEFEAHWVSS